MALAMLVIYPVIDTRTVVKRYIMKRIISLTNLVLAFVLSVSACSSSQIENTDDRVDTSPDPDRILIVYLSRTANTKAIAEIIQANVGGRLVSLELQTPYPENYQATVQQVASENERGFLPPLKTRIDSIEKYNVVFVGFPTWGMQLPPPMKSFLSQYDLTGKTIVPFNTNGGYGVGTSLQTVKELCTNSKILEGFTIKGGLERDGVLLAIKDEKRKEAESEVKNWLRKVNLLK
jgi:flavodoxin